PLFAAKWETAVLVSLACIIGVLLFSILGGFIVQFARPAYKMDFSTVDWETTVPVMFRYWIASFGIISIQYFLSLLIKSFAWPMTIGLMGTIAGGILAGNGLWKWWPWSATALTSSTYEGSITGAFLMPHEKLSLLWTVIFLVAAYQLFTRRTFARAVIFPVPRAVISVVVIAVFIAAAAYMYKPVVLSRHERTVIAGTITSETPVKQVLLLRPPAMDTVMIMPVKDGKFHGTTTEHLLPGSYYVRAGSFRDEVFFSSRDSLFLDIEFVEKKTKMKVRGTRVAENEYLNKGVGDYNSYMLSNYAYTYTPAEYARNVMYEWNEAVKQLNQYKTIDNIRPSDDFISLRKKIIASDLLNLVDNHYPGIHAVYYPNDSLKYPKSLDRLRKEVDLEDSSLALSGGFALTVMESMRNKSGRNDSAYFSMVRQIPNPALRNTVLFTTAQRDVFGIKDTVKRDQLLQVVLQNLTDEKLRSRISEKYMRMKTLQRNGMAPAIVAESLLGKKFTLADFAKRYVVIDVWATWCGPCLAEAPYFTQLAEQYTSESVAFVSISVDENKQAWRTAASGKNTKVLQVWTENAEDNFLKEFGISSIPRFILVGPKGVILNAEMPPPSEPEFEEILKREIVSTDSRTF
ncbi:MAG TPA: redoxin family protein, partial [Flavisolibacter sp.]